MIASGIEAYLPLERMMRQWSDRKKEITKPIFKSYLFVYQNTDEYHKVKSFPGFLQYVSFGNKVSTITESEMTLMKVIVENFNQKEITGKLIKGDKVKILSGPLEGYMGVLTKVQGKSKVALHIHQLKHSFILDISMNDVIKL